MVDSVLEDNIKLANRYDGEFGLILIDIDFFKNVNDTYGHQVGDTVLREFANILKSSVRETDAVGRWGGEEFLIVCQKTDLEGTITLAQGLREKIQDYKFASIEQLTASFGVSVFKAEDILELLHNKNTFCL